MPIIFSTTTPASPACQPPARIYFEAPDDALLARVTEKVAEMMGRHLSYTFHDEAPGGVTPIILEDVGPSAQPSPAAQALSAGPEAIAKLRHLYQNMVNGAVRDTASAKRIAEGLLAPAIEALERATPPAEQQAQPDECFPGEPKVAVPQGLISAACFAIRKKRDGGKVLEQLRRYSVGDRSQPLAPQQAAPKAAHQPAPAPLSEMPYEKRKAIQEGEQISASDAWFHARINMLDTLDRRNVFRAGFDRGWNAAIAAQGGK